MLLEARPRRSPPADLIRYQAMSDVLGLTLAAAVDCARVDFHPSSCFCFNPYAPDVNVGSVC